MLQYISLCCLRFENNIEGEGLQVAFGLVHLMRKMIMLIRRSLRCCRIWSALEVQFSNWFSRVLKNVIGLILCISMAHNVISCIEVAEITQTLKIADFTM